jgi:hypothetical protein
MIIELFDQEEGDSWRVSIDLSEHMIAQVIDSYRDSHQEYTVDGFILWLRKNGVAAERIDDQEYPVFYF